MRPTPASQTKGAGMDINEIKDKQAAGTLTRRELNKALAAVGIVSLAAPFASRGAAAQSGEAVSFTWAGYDIPELYKSYEAKNGSPPDYVIYADENEAFQKVRAGFQPDLAHPCSPMVSQWRDAGLIQAIDTNRLSNWPDVFPVLKSLKGTQFNGEQWFVPFGWGRTSITYRTDLVDWEGEDSWALLWDERYKGRLAVFDSVDETVFITAIYAGVDPCNMSDADLDKVMGLLEKQKPLLRFYAEDEGSVTQALASGEVVAALTWDSGVAQLKADGVPVRFMLPKEGVETWSCGLILMKDAPHADKAYDLLDSMISADSGEFLINDYGMGHCNARAFDRISDDHLASLQLPRDPSALLESGVLYCRFLNKDNVIERFQTMKAGY
jgi:spermidine/putrescine transport system substrate-binding protein